MDRATFEQAVQSDRLERWLHIGAPVGTTTNQLCVWRAGEWFTIATDERAGRIESTFRRFEDESTALDSALAELRFLKELLG
ncbi:hypothetical protein [Microbacterium sp. Leaf288]|uniref:hypothetical protein n=1 Tax=Microbacterium sp. Leaf288 TaxID=1736323 RepID=UPI0012F9D02D|nr:hypothetical protein [Microbacterium sp. Leaf288]